jgi:L-alanine-DL-glutamate epimerase-like enolase superfamily enzyme
MKITAISTRPLALKFREPYHWAGRVDLGTVNLLIEVTTDQGVTGYGETIAARPADIAIHALRGVTPLFIGESPFDVERLFARAVSGWLQP